MGSVVQEVSLIDLVKYISKRNHKLQAVLLQTIEEYIPKDSQEFLEIRKVILDETSGAFRAIIREVFGDVEYLV
jgi:hypothetical protein